MYQRTVLDNGLRVLTSEMPHTRSVSMFIAVGAGSRYEPDELAGLSHFLEHLPFKGTRSWPTALAISEAVEGVGGMMNAATDREMTSFWCKVASVYADRALPVIFDLIRHPLMDPAEMEKEREVILDELRMTNDYPAQVCDLLIDRALWPAQAMGRDVGGTAESVAAIRLDDVQRYMGQQYRPNNTVIGIAGGISHDDAVRLVATATEDWQPADPLPWEPVSAPSDGEPSVLLEHRVTEDTSICMGLPGFALADADRYAATVLNGVLGDGMSSRLFQNLRETRGLTYDCHSSLSSYRDCGALVVSCATEPSRAAEAIAATREELKGLLLPAPASEVHKAREYIKGRLLMRMEDSRAVASWLASQELLMDEITTPDETANRIDEVTPDDVLRAAERLVGNPDLRLAIVGPHDDADEFGAAINEGT
ncbi:MAG: insulinase family protein [Dehalococcoidia bacterium]|nr:insulinase family protein [Dehalococcoidia bacterium]